MQISITASSYNVGGAFQVTIGQSFGFQTVVLNGQEPVGITSPTGDFIYQGNFDQYDVGNNTWVFTVKNGPTGTTDTGTVTFSVSGTSVPVAAPINITATSPFVASGSTSASGGAVAQMVVNPANPGGPMTAIVPSTNGVGPTVTSLPVQTAVTTNQSTTSQNAVVQSLPTGVSNSMVPVTTTYVPPMTGGLFAVDPVMGSNTTNSMASSTTGTTASTATTGVTSTTSSDSNLFSQTVSIGGMDVPVWELAVVAVVGLMLLK